MATPTPEELVGSTLGSCRLEELLSVDASYAVYRAQHMQLLRAAVIKILHPDLASDPRRVELFKRIAAKVGVLNIGERDGVHFVELANDDRAWPNLAGAKKAPPTE